jgi:hypothetical protein
VTFATTSAKKRKISGTRQEGVEVKVNIFRLKAVCREG